MVTKGILNIGIEDYHHKIDRTIYFKLKIYFPLKLILIKQMKLKYYYRDHLNNNSKISLNFKTGLICGNLYISIIM